MAKGLGIVVSLVTVGIAGLFLYDIIFSKRCAHIIPVFDMMDTTCLLAGNKQAGILMDPTRVSDWLRSIQGSADIKYNRAVGDALSYSQKTGRQAVRPYTSPPSTTPGAGPKSPGRSQAVRPGTSTPTPTPRGASGAPQITPRGGASPLSFENFMQGLRNMFKAPMTYEQWLRWVKAGGDPGIGYRSGGIKGAIQGGLKGAIIK